MYWSVQLFQSLPYEMLITWIRCSQSEASGTAFVRAGG